MQKRLLLGLMLYLLAFGAISQEITIRGTVHQKGDNMPLQGVAVYLEGTSFGSSSSAAGNYEIKNVPVGNYVLVARLLGYDIKKLNLTLDGSSEVSIDFKLSENFTEISGVIIRGTSMTGGASGVNSVPGSAQYISPKELEKFSYSDINRILRSIPGINIQEEEGFGLRPNIGMRGTGVERSSKITLMEDGILIAPAPYAAPAAYYFPTVGRMQGIEVRKGSSQIKYGPYTTGGALNLISTQIPNELEGRINILGGNFGQRTVHANVGTSFKNGGFMVETYQMSADGFKELDNGGDTGFDSRDYLAKFRINTNPDAPVYQALMFKIGQTTGESNETYLGLTQEDFDQTPYRRYAGSQKDLMDTRHRQFSLQHVISPNNHIDVTTTAYMTQFDRNWYKLDKVRFNDPGNGSTSVGIASILDNPGDYTSAMSTIRGSGMDTLLVKANNRSYYSKGVQSIIGLQYQSPQWTHDIEAGIRIHRDEMDRYQWVDEYVMGDGIMELIKSGEPGTESNRIESANAIATFAQYTLSNGRYTFTPGLRYEHISVKREDYGSNDPERTGTSLSVSENIVGIFIPGLSVDYKLSSRLNTFIGVHKGFSPPGSREGTEPEESINYELGGRYGFAGLEVNGVVFLNDYSNLLGSDLAASGGAGTPDQFNGGQALVKGVELDLTYNILPVNNKLALPIQLVYTYTDGEFRNTFESEFEPWGNVQEGDKLPYMAPHQLAVNVTLESTRFNVNLSSKYISDMRTVAGQGEIPDNQIIGSQFVVDLSSNYFINKNISVFGSIRNITDEVYLVARRPAGLRPGLPRSFMLGVKAVF
ncbi:TonB-dependent receptor domain-containing protein [Fulvivirga sedimenti]|uniref:TonB-dependent receptor n=1 Tax=Fulvivirga sedimenti TaxID=2879465 RepID=A0A9X1HLY9_9BACT|nr:TonB-dependent receptor [Fulvivirga sedimenti]MCA6073268.1 TonB-dependent receptor [Fulvivirga sedimenti]